MRLSAGAVTVAALFLAVAGVQAMSEGVTYAPAPALPHGRTPWTTFDRPFVIGHRGSPAFFPEHSAASYLLAIESGADFIECDVVLTKDLVPVCRHEPALSATTDVMTSPFANRSTTYTIDGSNETDVFTVDLTLAELRSLRLKQKDPWRPASYDGLFSIVTLEEHISLALASARTVGIYPEMKHPTFFNGLLAARHPGANITIMDILLDTLTKYGYAGPYGSPRWLAQPIFIQSFEQNDLVYVSRRSCIPLVQLLDSPGWITPDRMKDYPDMITDASLDSIATYASGVGPWKNMVAAPNAAGTAIESTGLVAKLHARGLQVHIYTIRPEPRFIAPLWNNQTAFNELGAYFHGEGVDGAFCDSSAVCRAYMNAEEIAGKAWPLDQRMRLNHRPAGCKRGVLPPGVAGYTGTMTPPPAAMANRRR